MNAIRTFAEVKDHEVRIKLPDSVTSKTVELIIIPVEATTPSASNAADLQSLLLDAPDMSDEEYNLIMEKRKALNQWS